MVIPLLCLTYSYAHFNTDRAWRMFSYTSPAEAHHRNTIPLCFVAGCMNTNREGCVIQEICKRIKWWECFPRAFIPLECLFGGTPLRSFHYEQNNCLSPTSILQIT
jgi:hypothetical protein